MRPGLPAWRHLASLNEKCAYGYQNNKLWSYKTLAGPVATSEIVLLYVPKLTKGFKIGLMFTDYSYS